MIENQKKMDNSERVPGLFFGKVEIKKANGFIAGGRKFEINCLSSINAKVILNYGIIPESSVFHQKRTVPRS